MNTRTEVRKAIQNVQTSKTEIKVDNYVSIIAEILLDIRDLLEKNNKLIETSKRSNKQ